MYICCWEALADLTFFADQVEPNGFKEAQSLRGRKGGGEEGQGQSCQVGGPA